MAVSVLPQLLVHALDALRRLAHQVAAVDAVVMLVFTAEAHKRSGLLCDPAQSIRQLSVRHHHSRPRLAQCLAQER